MRRILLGLFVFLLISENCCQDEGNQEISTWHGSWKIVSNNNEPVWPSINRNISPRSSDLLMEDRGQSLEEPRGKLKMKKKFQKFLLPLLLAYKLKFFTLIPVLIGGLILLAGATGLAGFFFALFAAIIGLKTGHDH